MATLDQSNNTQPPSNGFGLWYFNNGKVANSFTPSVTAALARIDITSNGISGSPSGYNVVMRIFTDSAGSPSSTQVGGDSDVIAAASWPANLALASFTWSSNAPALTASTLYWMVITTSTESNSTTQTCAVSDNGGAGTSYYGSHLAKANNGGGWTVLGDGTINLSFAEYYVGPPNFSVTDTTAVSDTPKIDNHAINVSESTAVSDTVTTSIFDLIQYLLVAGGGRGGTTSGGGADGAGGGAGGQVTSGSIVIAAPASYPIVVGGSDQNSSAFSVTALAGGKGGDESAAGSNGGNGGGAGGLPVNSGSTTLSGGTGSPGFNGGSTTTLVNGDHTGGAGGAGNGGVGGSANRSGAGNGGGGTSSSISGSSVAYGGGAGGGNTSSGGGTGTDGGGNGGVDGPGTAGAANRGGGGGGAGKGNQAGSLGGSGVAIIRYLTAGFGSCTGGTITTDGAFTVHTFTTSGTFVAVPKFLSLSVSDAAAVAEPLVKVKKIPTFTVVKDLAAAAVVSGYKWLTTTLLSAQQQFAVRPYFTTQVIDDTIQPLAALFSGAGTPLGQGSMARAPDGKLFAVGLDGSNNLKVFSAVDLNGAAGVWPASVTLNTAGDNSVDSRNNYSIGISDYYKGFYRITVWYFGNFINDGSNLQIFLQYSDDGGATWTKSSFSPSGLPNNSIGNLSLASMKPVWSAGVVNVGCFYLKPTNITFASGFKGYDVFYAYGNPAGSMAQGIKWYQNANSFDWTLHSLGAFYLNGVQYCVFSGFRNILDSVGLNANYSIWVTALLNVTQLTGKDLWTAPVAVMPVGSASNTNKNSFTLPSATVSNGVAYITMNAQVVDSVSQTSQGSAAQTVTTHTNYMMIQSDDGKQFSYPTVLASPAGVEFNSGAAASFVPQNGFWWLGAAAGYLWQYTQNNIVADVTADVIGYSIQETAGQPSSVSLQIGNANNKWVGAAPTGPGAAAISKNKKIAIWQGYYNASGATEAVPHSVYYIDDIQQQVTSTQNDVTLVGRDLYKKLKTTVTKFSYQFAGSVFFSDIFDGTFISSWNQLVGTWVFDGTTSPPELLLTASGGAEDKIMLVGSNGASYGHLMRIFVQCSNSGTGYVYGAYIDASNWLRLELNCSDKQSWAVVKSVAGVTTTLDSGTMPTTMVLNTYYGVIVRRYDYFKFSFMITGDVGQGINSFANYNPANVSYAFAGGGSGEYDLSSTFSSSASWQAPFTVGIGSASGPSKFRFFMMTTLTDPSNIGTLMRRLARIAGVFAFKISYTWRELLFAPSLTGTYSVTNRKIQLAPGGQAVSNTNSMSNGQVSFMAKMTASNASAVSGFRFIFRGDSATPANAYYLHMINDPTVSPGATFARFERLVSSLGGAVLRFFNTGYDVTNAVLVGSLNLDMTQWHSYKVSMIDGWFFAYVDDVMVASWNDNSTTDNYLTSGTWGFSADANTSLQVGQVTAPDFWKPVQSFAFNSGDDAESSIESLLTALRAWMFSDMFGRFKAVFLGSSNPSTYTYNSQLFQQDVDSSDKEYVSQVTVYGSGVSATARNTTLMAGVPTREAVVVDYTILTQQDAQTRANNELTNFNQYQSQYTPKQVMNVGAEIFDAVTVVNTGSNTSGVNGPTRTYAQKLQQGGGNSSSDYSIELNTGTL